MQYWQGDKIELLNPNDIAIIGTNPESRHGAGLAEHAVKHWGLRYGVAHGPCGRCYALVTKNLTAGFTDPVTGVTYVKEGYMSVSRANIERHIATLYEYACKNPQLKFYVPYKIEYWTNGRIKRSLCGYSGEHLKIMFNAMPVPDNIIFHESFRSNK